MDQQVRRTAFHLATSFAVSMAAVQISAALGSVVVLELSGRLALTGLPFFLSALSSILASYPAGRFMDRYGRVPILALGYLLAAFGGAVGLAGILARHLLLFLAGSFVFSLGANVAFLTRLAAADLYPPERRAQGLSLVVFAATFGAILGTPLVVLAQRLAAPLGVSYLAAAWMMLPPLSLASALVVRRIRVDPRQVALQLHAPPASAPAAIPASAPRRRGALATAALGLVLAQAAMVTVMSVAGASLEHAGHPIQFRTPPYLLTLPTLIGVTMTSHIVGMFVFSPWIGRMADRRGRRPVMLLGAALLVSATLLSTFVAQAEVLGLSVFLIGIGWSFAFVPASALVADLVPPLRRGRATGLLDVASSSGSALAALAAGAAVGAGGISGVSAIALALSLGVLVAAVAGRFGPAGSGRPRPTPIDEA